MFRFNYIINQMWGSLNTPNSELIKIARMAFFLQNLNFY